MNLIVNRQLDRAQKQKIYELTLKKRQSKKSTMSEMQVAARQQLAKELMQERRVLPDEEELLQLEYRAKAFIQEEDVAHLERRQQQLISDDQSLDNEPNSTVSIGTNTSANTSSKTASTNGSSCSFSRSESSYSGSSQDSGAQIGLLDDEFMEARKKEANVKFNKTRLEHLNCELERRLHQYEYLVAQEKALLGTYNMVLFTSEGVNNFHLYDAFSTPSRRIRTHLQKTGVHRDSAASSSSISTNNSNSANKTAPKTRAQLNSSASTLSNLNNLHMLPSLAGPRRSASSVALLTMNQSQIIE